MASRPAAYSEVVEYWRGVKSTLRERGLLRQWRQVESGERELVLPQATALVAPEWVAFVLDMQRLGGVPRERWLDPDLWAQMRATLQGRRCFVADSAGLAVVIGRDPNAERRARLPTRLVMTPDRTPEGAYTALLGVAAGGDVLLDLADRERSILVGGASGAGKTRSIISWVLQLARKHGPDRLALAIVDLKRLDLIALDGLPHLVEPVATTETDAEALAAWCVGEMERRQAVMQSHQVTRWDRLPEGERFPLLLVVIDECADFENSPVMQDLVKLARKGRASGVSLVLATQRPDAQVLSRQVKANVTTRLAFRVTDSTESRIILDRTGAERIKRVGRCLANVGGQWRKVQAGFVPDDQTGEWCEVAPSGPALSEIERALVAHAVGHLDGAFTINALASVFKGEISRRQLLKLGQSWERRGWLTSPDDVTQARRVTDELIKLARGNGGNGRDTAFEAVVPRSTGGNVVPEIAPGAGLGSDLPPFLAARFQEVQR